MKPRNMPSADRLLDASTALADPAENAHWKKRFEQAPRAAILELTEKYGLSRDMTRKIAKRAGFALIEHKPHGGGEHARVDAVRRLTERVNVLEAEIERLSSAVYGPTASLKLV